MRDKFLKSTHPVHIAPSTVIAACEDMFASGFSSDIVSLKLAEAAVFTIITNANGSGGQGSVYIYACTDVTPTTTTPIAFRYQQIEAADTVRPVSDATSAGFATSTGANIIYRVEVDQQEVVEQSCEFVQLVVTEKTNQAVDGAVFCELVDIAHVRSENLPTQVT